MTEVGKSVEQAEQKSVERTPDKAAVSGVIGGKANQDVHDQAHALCHANDKTLSEPDLIAINENETTEQYKARVAKIQANRFGFYDSEQGESEHRKTLIAQSSDNGQGEAKNPPYGFGADGRWHFQNPKLKPGQNIAGALREWFWNDSKNLPRDTVNGTWALSEQLLKGINEWMQKKPDLTYMEYLTGRESERGRSPWNDVSFEGADKAYAVFPVLAQHQIPKELISGIILNEVLHNGDVRDLGEELSVQMFGTVRDWDGQEKATASVGPAQIQIRNIYHLVEKYPELSRFSDDPLRAAVNRETAPMFVAAYLADKIDVLEKYNENHADKPIPITSATIAYMYNPDVLSDSGHYRQIDTYDKVASNINIDTRDGWKSEPVPKNDEIILRSKVVQDILNATKACYR